MCIAHEVVYDEKWSFFYVFYPATGALLAVSLQLITEDFKSRIAAIATQVAVHAAWLGISLYLTQFDSFSLPQIIAVFATVVTMALSLLLACFYRKGDDVPFWNFAWRTLMAIVAGIMVGGVLTLGLYLFVQSLDWLFGVKVNDTVFIDIAVICMVLVAPLLAMSQIPESDDKHDRRVVRFSGFIKGVTQYLFIPLLLLYLVTLYTYAAKILFTWQLPVGWVSYLVSASMFGMLVLLFITYPVQYEQERSFFKTITRWLPLAMLPLLALMTVAIGRRLSDYGITVSRLYVLVFNIWCYVVCIGLLLSRNKRIWWVPASFAVVLFLISVGPQSIANITRHQLLKEVRSMFLASGIKQEQFPLDGEQYEKWLSEADVKTAAAVDSKLDYLYSNYYYNSISGLLGMDAGTGHFITEDGKVVIQEHSLSFSNRDLIDNIAIPRGYTTMTYLQSWTNVMMEGERVSFVIEAYDKGGEAVSHRFEMDVKRFAEKDYNHIEGNSVSPLYADNGNALFIFNTFTLTDDYLNYDGLLLTK